MIQKCVEITDPNDDYKVTKWTWSGNAMKPYLPFEDIPNISYEKERWEKDMEILKSQGFEVSITEAVLCYF
jgi:hypothetical protein